MNVLLLGASGQLAKSLILSKPKQINLISLTRAQLDITNYSALKENIALYNPTVIINAAAYTQVDQAEAQPEIAIAINATAIKHLVQECTEKNIHLIHFSTDYVFNGKNNKPYLVSDKPEPGNIYGLSKLNGEVTIQQNESINWTIIRTAWVYSQSGNNFYNTMLRLLALKEKLNIVSDQISTPTHVDSLAKITWQITLKSITGLYHWTDAGVASWYDFAVAIQRQAQNLGILKNHCQIIPINTEQYPLPARRPFYSVLDKSKIIDVLNINQHIHWQEKLEQILKNTKTGTLCPEIY